MIKFYVLSLSLILSGSLFAQQNKSSILIPYRVKNLWGFADTLGNLKVNPQYKAIEPKYYYNSKEQKTYARFVVKKATAASVLDENMQVKVPETYAYDSVKASVTYYEMDIFKVYKGGMAGLFTNGRQLISCQYSQIETTSNGSFIVQKDGLKGLVNSTGKLIIPVKYQSIRQDFDAGDEQEKFTWIARGMITAERFTDVRVTSAEDEIRILDEVIDGHYTDTRDPFAAKKTELGRQYQAVRPLRGYNEYVYIDRNGKTGIYDLKKDRVLLAPEYENLQQCTPGCVWRGQGIYFRFSENGRQGIINLNGQVLLPAEYTNVRERMYGYELETEGKKGAYIYKRKVLIPTLYESIEQTTYVNGSFMLFYVKTPEGYGYIGENGVVFFSK